MILFRIPQFELRQLIPLSYFTIIIKGYLSLVPDEVYVLSSYFTDAGLALATSYGEIPFIVSYYKL